MQASHRFSPMYNHKCVDAGVYPIFLRSAPSSDFAKPGKLLLELVNVRLRKTLLDGAEL